MLIVLSKRMNEWMKVIWYRYSEISIGNQFDVTAKWQETI